MRREPFGRNSVLTSIQRMLDALEQQRGSVVLLEGAAGSGKTHLLNVAAGEARQRGVRTLRITPETAGSPPDCPGARCTTDGRTLPQLILIDDAHQMSVQVLEAMLRRPAATAHDTIGLLLALRCTRSRPDIERLLDKAQPEPMRLTLGPLPRGAIIRLATDLLGAPPDPDLLDWILSAGGDPYLTRALVEGLREENRVRQEHGLTCLATTDAPGGPLPLRIHDAVRLLLAGVTTPCRQLLYTAAVVEPRIDPERVAQILKQTTAALLPVWEEALLSDLLRDSAGELVFTHEMLRQAVAESLPASLRAALRRQHHRLEQPPPGTEGPDAIGSHTVLPVETGGARGMALPAIGAPAGTGLVTLADASDLSDALPTRLTGRERTVLSLLAHGRSNQQIASALGISTHAVKRHVSNLLIKLDCTNRTEVALVAARLERRGPVSDSAA